MRILALLALLVPCVACDQATKILAVTHLKGTGEVRVVDGMFRLVYAENPGAFMSLGAHLPDHWRVALFACGTALLLAAMAVVVARRKLAPALFLGLALLVAGGVGNLVDRFVRDGGRVVDFAQLGVPTPWGALRTGVFNVADLQIVGGAVIIAALSLRRRAVPSQVPRG